MPGALRHARESQRPTAAGRAARPPAVVASAAAAATADAYADGAPKPAFQWQVRLAQGHRYAHMQQRQQQQQHWLQPAGSFLPRRRRDSSITAADGRPPPASRAPCAALLCPAPTPSQGAKLLPLAASLAVGLALRFLVHRPAAVTAQGWNLLCIFASTIAGAVQRRALQAWRRDAAAACVRGSSLQRSWLPDAAPHAAIIGHRPAPPRVQAWCWCRCRRARGRCWA